MDTKHQKEVMNQMGQHVDEIIKNAELGKRVINFYRFLWNKDLTGSIVMCKSGYGTFSVWAHNKGTVVQSKQKVFEGHGVTIDEALDDITREFVKHGIC